MVNKRMPLAAALDAQKNVREFLRRKNQRKRSLAEWGVDLKNFKEEFEDGIINGFHP